MPGYFNFYNLKQLGCNQVKQRTHKLLTTAEQALYTSLRQIRDECVIIGLKQ